MLQYFIPLIVFCGYILGYLIKKYIPEEQKDAQAYFHWAKKAIIIVLIFVLIITNSWSWYALLFLLVGIILGMFVTEIYLYLSLSILSLELLPASVCFLYGLVAGEKKNLFRNALFFCIPFLFLLFSFDLSFLQCIAAGALVSRVFKKKVL